MNAQMNHGFQMIHDIFRLRWIPEIIGAVAENNHRYTDISDHIEFISNTELNRKLALLQERGVIEKKDVEGREGYYLSEFGTDLNHIFMHFQEMSEKYIEKTSNHELI